MHAHPSLPPVGGELDWLVRGRDGRCHTADLLPPDCLHAAFVRSPHAHARIESISSEPDAEGGVLAVLTADDLNPAWKPIPCIVPITNRDGSQRADPPRTLLASGVVCHEGEAVAMVVARTAHQARAAASKVKVRYTPLPAVTDGLAALAPNAPQVRAEVPGNLCFDWELGQREESDAVFRGADHVVELDLRNNRVVVAPLEARSAIGWCEPASGRKVLVSATQGVHWTRDVIARDVLGIDPATLEVVTPRVGGSFGVKIFVYPEQVLVLVAAERLGLPVKWVSSRSEAFLTDTQGRDHHTHAAMALDRQGRILALRAETVSNLGAHLSNYAPFNATTCGAPLLCGCYRIGSVYAHVRGVMTNTPPVDSYRGAGRPEANYVVERLIDEAATVMKIDRAELRRRNLVRAQDLPFTTATGLRIDSGLFQENQIQALALSDYEGFGVRQAESRRRGRLRGIGIANFLEANGGMALARLMEPAGKPRESARLAFKPDGVVRLDIGTQGSGQGHAHSYALLVAKALGLPSASIEVHQGNTTRLAQSTGTGGSKSLLSGSTAILAATDAVLVKAAEFAAEQWDVEVESLDWVEGRLHGPHGATTDLAELVRTASTRQRAQAHHHPFDVEFAATISTGTYGNGCHVCEVEIDPETGTASVVRYVAVNDFGTLVAPDQVLAQLQGGIAQGIGQALHEDCRFDGEDGRLISKDFGSYHLPQASDFPALDIRFNGSPCLTNRLGIKGCGEAGASAAPPAVINAVQHALAGSTREPVQMPATAQQLWGLLHAVKREGQ